MNETLNILPAAQTASLSPLPDLKTSSAADLISSFKQILSTSMMSTDLTSSGNEGSSMQSLLLPLMLVMIEQLLAKTLEENKSSEEEASAQAPAQVASSTSTKAKQSSNSGNVSASSAASATSKTSSDTGSSSVPHGHPVNGVLTQNFHTGHNGMDIGVPVGTPVKTTMDGKVVYAGWNNQGYGNLVIVQNGSYRTYYAHLSSIPVKVGDQVTGGSVVAYSGNTGNSTGPHLHYEVRRSMVPQNPANYM